MKKLINNPRNVVREMLEGAVLTTDGLALLADENVVLRADIAANPEDRPVALISGGGSGHEPAHAGYVGAGMLSAAVVGDVFTSPSVDAVLAAIVSVAGPAGALLIVKNYTGDRLNFGLAAELARRLGIPVEIVVVADDVALRNTVPAERRRGIAGTVLVHKVAGAAAAGGAPLSIVAQLARDTAEAVGTMGVGLGACIVPAAGKPGFELGEDEIEYGLGIHGEKGVERGPMAPADTLAEVILDTILTELELDAGQEVALMVNGLGATTQMELAIVARRALGVLAERGLAPVRVFVGNFMTALEMPGCSLSVLPVDGGRLAALDAPTLAPAWSKGAKVETLSIVDAAMAEEARTVRSGSGRLAPRLKHVLTSVAVALEAAEAELTDLDARTGDGDLGASMARGAAAARELGDESYSAPAHLLADLGNALRRAIAGSSGPFYATALLRAAQVLDGVDTPNGAQWRAAFTAAVTAVAEIGGAGPGDRTMLDALIPAAAAFEAGDWRDAARAAAAGAEATAGMLPRLGRASYLGERALGVPDGGAVAVAIWIAAIAAALGQD